MNQNLELFSQNRLDSSLFDFSAFPDLETERLLLRRITSADTEAIFAIRGDFAVTRYNIGAAYGSLEQARTLITDMEAGYEAQCELRWGIVYKPENRLIGMCGYNYWSRPDFRGSIGYDLAQHYWGRGIMPEALRAVIDFGFAQMGLNRIEANSSAANTASVRVLQKLGFRQEGHQREQYFEHGAFHDLLLFALLKREFLTGASG